MVRTQDRNFRQIAILACIHPAVHGEKIKPAQAEAGSLQNPVDIESSPGTVEIPIFTGGGPNNKGGSVLAGSESGFDHFLLKPFFKSTHSGAHLHVNLRY